MTRRDTARNTEGYVPRATSFNECTLAIDDDHRIFGQADPFKRRELSFHHRVGDDSVNGSRATAGSVEASAEQSQQKTHYDVFRMHTWFALGPSATVYALILMSTLVNGPIYRVVETSAVEKT